MPTILVADDEYSARNILQSVLEAAGYTVLTATNGQEALDLAQRERPHLILMDLTMPVMMGWEATERIKAIPELATVPIIAFTAYGLGSELDRAFRAGCSDFLSKPVDEHIVIQTVQAHLASSN